MLDDKINPTDSNIGEDYRLFLYQKLQTISVRLKLKVDDTQSVKTEKLQYSLKKKIRIGYVLKSADVGTLFSGRNSEK